MKHRNIGQATLSRDTHARTRAPPHPRARAPTQARQAPGPRGLSPETVLGRFYKFRKVVSETRLQKTGVSKVSSGRETRIHNSTCGNSFCFSPCGWVVYKSPAVARSKSPSPYTTREQGGCALCPQSRRRGKTMIRKNSQATSQTPTKSCSKPLKQ